MRVGLYGSIQDLYLYLKRNLLQRLCKRRSKPTAAMVVLYYHTVAVKD